MLFAAVESKGYEKICKKPLFGHLIFSDTTLKIKCSAQVPGGLGILERKEIQHTIYEPLNWEMPMEKWKHKSLGDSIPLLLISILPFLEKTIFN